MKKIFVLLLVLTLALTACTNGGNNNNNQSNNNQSNNNESSTNVESNNTDSSDESVTEEEMVAPEGLSYSDNQVYKTVYSGEVTTLNYLVTASTAEFGIAANFVDTLVDYDNYGALIPSLAKDWSVSDDGLVWTFNLREGVNWYTHEGDVYAETVAQDFVDSLEYIFESENGSKTANIAYDVIVNAEAYYNKEITDFNEVGVKAIDKYTVEYTLNSPVPYFESMLTYVSFFPANGDFLAEKGTMFGTSNENLLYNGAYIMEKFEPQNKRVLVKNENYWDKEKVHIEEINYKYNKEASTIGQELFLRNEISYVEIGSDSIDAWMNDKTLKDKVRPANSSFYTYFYTLNFDPQYDEAYDPQDWKIAVNNLNFRKAFFHGFDRIAALTVDEPYTPENKISNTVTPASFVNYAGKDFTNMGSLGEFSKTDTFDSAEALKYKDLAMKELDGQVEFPIKVVIPYSTSGSANAQKAQVVKQQLENLLGDDFINVFIVPYPPSGYLSNTRRAGNYSFMEVNWGPDYADPHTYTEMFRLGGNYNFPDLSTETDENGKLKYDVYHEMVAAASEETVDIQKRFGMYAEAEAYLMEQAWVIPYRKGGGGYVSSLLNPFDSAFSPFGVASERWKGSRLLDSPMNTELYLEEKAKWEAAREEALK